MSSKPPLVLTMGEPAGAGPELAALAWRQRRVMNLKPFVYLGDMVDLAARIKQCGIVVPLREATLADAASVFGDAMPVIHAPLKVPSRAGKPTAENAAAVLHGISTAASFCLNGQATGMITNPIQKATLADVMPYPGHTELLGTLSVEAGHADTFPVMMLACDELRTVPITVHCSLTDVPRRLTADLIMRTARVVQAGLRKHFGFHTPRLTVCGLNPHAGEDGMLGREEIEIIQPALDALRREGLKLRGPLPADSVFHAAARDQYDAALCMYHDQALIPIKTLAFERAVNVTLGLPFIRTSPDHGTALDLAGTGKASPTSLIEAIKMAGELAALGAP